MYPGTVMRETVSVMGTPAFMEFVELIQSEGVTFERVPMGEDVERKDSLLVEVETESSTKDLETLDIDLPRLSRRFQRDYRDLEELDPAALPAASFPLKPFSADELRMIVFKTLLDGEIDHTITLDGLGVADYRSVVGFFARSLLNDLRLVGGYDILFGKLKQYLRDSLFATAPVELEDQVVLRNLAEPEVVKRVLEIFRAAINALTVRDQGNCRIEDRLRLRQVRPFRTDWRPHLTPRKSLFNRIVGEAHAEGLELAFARFLDEAPDVVAFAKNYHAVGFKIDYVKSDGDISVYLPDFLVKTVDGTVWIVETKGREELELPRKMTRLAQWCADASAAETDGRHYDFVYVDEEGFTKHRPTTFAALAAGFREYKDLP
jgi:type III restriction enzyme